MIRGRYAHVLINLVTTVFSLLTESSKNSHGRPSYQVLANSQTITLSHEILECIAGCIANREDIGYYKV